MAPGELASESHPAALRGSTDGHPPAGWPKPRAALSAVQKKKNVRPFVMAQQLRDSCRRWLLAGENNVDHIIDRLVREQFIVRLPKKTAQWVQRHHPASLDLAI